MHRKVSFKLEGVECLQFTVVKYSIAYLIIVAIVLCAMFLEFQLRTFLRDILGV